MVKTLAELREENKRLKERMDMKSEFMKERMERQRLTSENRRLRNPKTYGFIQKVGKGFVETSKIAGRGLESIGRSAIEFEKKQRLLEKKKRGKIKTRRKK